MSDDAASGAERSSAPQQESTRESQEKRVFLVSYPKIIFLYPTFLVALVAGIYMLVAGDAPGEDPGRHRHDTEILALIFLVFSTVNLIVLSFDFPRTTSLTLFFLVAAVVMGGLLLFQFKPELLPVVGDTLNKLHPWANAQFYLILAGILALIFVGVLISVRFDYWEVRPNELLHHHGVLSNLERFSAPNLRIDKEINDVFEYLLLGAGRLILHPSNERRAVVLENVFFITRKETEITQMLGALQVQVRSDTGP